MDVITRQKLIKGIKAGDIWLNKVKYHGTKRIRGNVCLEVYLPSRGTCLLQHVNLGACTFEQIPTAFVQGMQELCKLHSRNRCWRDWRIPQFRSRSTSWTWSVGSRKSPAKIRCYVRTVWTSTGQFNEGVEKATVAYTLVKKINEGIQAATAVARATVWSERLQSLLQPLVATAHRTLMGLPVLQKSHHLLLVLLTVTLVPLVSRHILW